MTITPQKKEEEEAQGGRKCSQSMQLLEDYNSKYIKIAANQEKTYPYTNRSE